MHSNGLAGTRQGSRNKRACQNMGANGQKIDIVTPNGKTIATVTTVAELAKYRNWGNIIFYHGDVPVSHEQAMGILEYRHS